MTLLLKCDRCGKEETRGVNPLPTSYIINNLTVDLCSECEVTLQKVRFYIDAYKQEELKIFMEGTHGITSK